MGNTSSRSETIEKSDREVQIANILQNTSGGFTESEIHVQIEDIVGGGSCGKDTEREYREGNLLGGNDEIDVKIEDLQGGAGSFENEDHQAIYQEIKKRIHEYQQKGGSSSANNEFFQMLERKLNGVDSDSPFISSNKNNFIKTLQGGRGNDYTETETATVTAKKLLNTIVQMGGEDSDSSEEEDSDFTSTEGSSGEEDSDVDSDSDLNTDTFADVRPITSAKRASGKITYDSDEDYKIFLSSSSLETDDINLISYSPRQ